MGAITFTIPYALPSLNSAMRTHWAKRSRDKHALALDVMAAMKGPAHFPVPPLRHVHIVVTRRGRRMLDADNLAGACKPLIDVLCRRSRTHPAGLSIIEDDRPELVKIEYRQSTVSRDASTTVRIMPITEEEI